MFLADFEQVKKKKVLILLSTTHFAEIYAFQGFPGASSLTSKSVRLHADLWNIAPTRLLAWIRAIHKRYICSRFYFKARVGQSWNINSLLGGGFFDCFLAFLGGFLDGCFLRDCFLRGCFSKSPIKWNFTLHHSLVTVLPSTTSYQLFPAPYGIWTLSMVHECVTSLMFHPFGYKVLQTVIN